jgi:Uma2 family endonuclease
MSSIPVSEAIAKLNLGEENVVFPPNSLWSDEPPLESDLHREQIELLLACLKWYWCEDGSLPRNDYYASGNLTIYYSEDKITTRDFRGPDFFVVLGVENHPRRSWMVWAEGGKYPNVIVELLSNSTAAVDRGTKKDLYQDIFRTPEYFWFHPETLEFQGFELIAGQYQNIAANSQGWLWSQQLQLFLGVENSRLRFFTPAGHLILNPEEMAKQAAEALERERKQRERALQQVEALRAKLRELGIDPDTVNEP